MISLIEVGSEIDREAQNDTASRACAHSILLAAYPGHGRRKWIRGHFLRSRLAFDQLRKVPADRISVIQLLGSWLGADPDPRTPGRSLRLKTSDQDFSVGEIESRWISCDVQDSVSISCTSATILSNMVIKGPRSCWSDPARAAA